MLGLSQPALSASLGRLRRYFDDELLRRVGNAYELTPLAVILAERTSKALNAAGQVFTVQASFEPRSSEREFSLHLSDYAMSVLSVHLARITRAEAPGVRMRMHQLNTTVVENASAVLRESDGIVLPHGFLDSMPHQDLFTDTFVCLVSADNDQVGAEVSPELLVRLPMVVAYKDSSGGNTAVHHLRMAGIEPSIDTVTDSFLTVPFLVAGTDRIALVPALLARRFEALGDVRAFPCPLPTGELVDALWWHPIHDEDPGHLWFRDLLRRAAAAVGSS